MGLRKTTQERTLKICVPRTCCGAQVFAKQKATRRPEKYRQKATLVAVKRSEDGWALESSYAYLLFYNFWPPAFAGVTRVQRYAGIRCQQLRGTQLTVISL